MPGMIRTFDRSFSIPPRRSAPPPTPWRPAGTRRRCDRRGPSRGRASVSLRQRRLRRRRPAHRRRVGRAVPGRAKSPSAEALTTDVATITSVANDYSYDLIFARQLEARPAPGRGRRFEHVGQEPERRGRPETGPRHGLKTIAFTGRTGPVRGNWPTSSSTYRRTSPPHSGSPRGPLPRPLPPRRSGLSRETDVALACPCDGCRKNAQVNAPGSALF